MKKVMLILVLVSGILGYIAGYHFRPAIGMGIYFEEGNLVIDGGRHQGTVFNGNTVDITLPDWIRDTLGDEPYRNSTTRNFHFSYVDCKPNVVKLPDKNRTIVVEGDLSQKTFIDTEGD